MIKVSFGKALLAGFVGWVVMTIVLLMAPLMGVPKMSIPAMLGGMFGLNSIALGWVMHLMIGLVFGIVYAYWLEPHLTGPGWFKGLKFSLIPWIVLMVIVAPMMPMVDPMIRAMPPGFFFANMGLMATMGTLVAHLAYGVVLGAMYGTPSKA